MSGIMNYETADDMSLYYNQMIHCVTVITDNNHMWYIMPYRDIIEFLGLDLGQGLAKVSIITDNIEGRRVLYYYNTVAARVTNSLAAFRAINYAVPQSRYAVAVV